MRVLEGRFSGRPLAWDVAYFDPPCAADYSAAPELFAGGRVFKRRGGGVLVVEHTSEKRLPERSGCSVAVAATGSATRA